MDVSPVTPLVPKVQPRFGGRNGGGFEKELAKEEGEAASPRRPRKDAPPAGEPRPRGGTSGTDGLKVDLFA